MKRIYIALITTFLLTGLFVNEAKAQQAVTQAAGTPIGYMIDCLGVDVDVHTATLSIKPDGKIKPQGKTDTVIYVCITAANLGTLCTTGVKELDNQWHIGISDGQLGSLEQLQKIVGQNGTVGGVDSPGKNPTKTNDAGTAFTEIVKWTDVYDPAVLHQFLWLQAITQENGQGAAGNQGAQQQGTFDFVKITQEKNCARIGWDPRGYVFDATSLNPVEGVQVTLFKGNSGSTFTQVDQSVGVVNPQFSSNLNGQYSFFVEPGFYKLNISSPNATIASPTMVNRVAQDIFIDENGKTNIYQADQEVEEKKGMVAIAHIPVTIVDSTAKIITELKVLENLQTLEDNGQINIFGRVSHPKSKIIITLNYIDATATPISRVKVDKTNALGEYDIYINQKDEISGNATFTGGTVNFELNSFYKTATFSKNENTFITLIKKAWNYFSEKIMVNASTSTSFNFKPIPTYIDGIAYDTNGQAISGAIVGVYPFFSNKPMYLTVADKDGRYKIGSQHLPQSAYELRYRKPTGEIIVVDTTTFIKQNVKFFAAENIKPFSNVLSTSEEEKKDQEFFANTKVTLELTPTAGEKKNSLGNVVSDGRNPSGGKSVQPGGGLIGSGMQGIMMIVVVIMVLVMIGVGAFIMMKSKQQVPPSY